MTLHFMQGYLSHFGFLAWVLLFGGIGLALWKLKRWPTRALAIAGILGVFAAYPGRWAWEVQKRVEHNETGHAMFVERCKTQAGYKINRVVEDVDGILLPKVRHRIDEYDPMAPGAAFAKEGTDDGYLASFLSYRYPSSGVNDNSYFLALPRTRTLSPVSLMLTLLMRRTGSGIGTPCNGQILGKIPGNRPKST